MLPVHVNLTRIVQSYKIIMGSYMWQYWVKIKQYSVVPFNHVGEFEVL